MSEEFGSKADDLINWSGISKHFTGDPTYIRKGKIPKKYREKIKELQDFIEYWRTKHPGKGK